MSRESDQERLQARIKELAGWELPLPLRVMTDTSDCMRITRGNVIQVEGHEFLIKGHKYESRFGIADQPKYWVFSAVDLETGEPKILKTVFHEDFHVHIGVFRIHCYRSPDKESQVLQLTQGDHRFMQGYTTHDDHGNSVRVIDYIRGQNLMQHIYDINKDHRCYFDEDLPQILRKLTDSIEAIALLHEHGTCHGDIRNDHVILDAHSGRFRWIDFDLNQHVADFDVWSIGNVINYAVGKGINSFQGVLKSDRFPDEVKQSLTNEDGSAFYEYRIMNLKKLYPYIPERLSRILLHFTTKPRDFYGSMNQLLDDYHEMLDSEFADN